MAIVSSALPIGKNLTACNARLKGIEKALSKLEGSLQNIDSPTKNDNETGRAYNMDNETNPGICSLTKQIAKSTEVATKIKAYNVECNEMMSYASSNLDHPYAPIIIKRTQLTALHSKKITLGIKKSASKGIRDILMNAETGTGSAGTMILAAPIMAIMMAFSALCSLITIILKGIEKILSLMPKILSVGAQSMCFFMTPKSLKKTDMTVINANSSITDKLPEAVKKTILDIQNKQQKLNIPIKVASISAGAAAGIASIKNGGKLNIPKGVCKSMEYVTAYNIISSIDNLIALLPFAEPMPKYERLSITNPGFLVWLITGFVPAGHKSFGIPFMP